MSFTHKNTTENNPHAVPQHGREREIESERGYAALLIPRLLRVLQHATFYGIRNITCGEGALQVLISNLLAPPLSPLPVFDTLRISTRPLLAGLAESAERRQQRLYGSALCCDPWCCA